MFQFPGFAADSLWIQPSTSTVSRRRLPDSETSGSTLVSSSPELFAAVHVLHRLLTPRHPPHALCSLTVSLRHVVVAPVGASNASSSYEARGQKQGSFDEPNLSLSSQLPEQHFVALDGILVLLQLSKTRIRERCPETNPRGITSSIRSK